MPEAQVGYTIDTGSSYYFSNQFDPHLGLYLGVIGRSISGKEAVKYGLATHYIHTTSMDKIR